MDDAPRMLIVEENPATRKVLGAIFRRLGWDVQTARTVTDALWRLSEPFDCIITGLTLPDSSGEAVLEAVAASRMAARVVVITGTDDRRRLASLCARFPGVAVVMKPFEVGTLKAACDRRNEAIRI